MNTMFIDYIDNYFIIQFVMLAFTYIPHNTIKMHLYNYFRIHICMNDSLFPYDANMSYLANKCTYYAINLQMYLKHIISYPDICVTSFMLFSIIKCMHISYNTITIRIFITNYVTLIIISSSFSNSIIKQICIINCHLMDTRGHVYLYSIYINICPLCNSSKLHVYLIIIPRVNEVKYSTDLVDNPFIMTHGLIQCKQLLHYELYQMCIHKIFTFTVIRAITNIYIIVNTVLLLLNVTFILVVSSF